MVFRLSTLALGFVMWQAIMLLTAPLVSAQRLNCSFSAWQNLVADGSVRLRHVINPTNSTVSVEIESNDDSGWLGFGFSNTAQMVGSKAVVGLPRRNRVQKYALNGKLGFRIRPLGTQVLTATSITQDGGKTVLKYTQPLVDAGDDAVIKAGQAVRFIWAQGRFNFFGNHQKFGVGATTIANCTRR